MSEDAIISENTDIITAWDKLNKINNEIEVIETELAINGDISSSKLKDILIQCSFNDANNKIINIISSRDENCEELLKKFKLKNTYENYILKEIQRMKLSEPMIAIAFLKEYQKCTWKEITKIIDYSEKQCRRYYNLYKDRKRALKIVFRKDDQKRPD